MPQKTSDDRTAIGCFVIVGCLFLLIVLSRLNVQIQIMDVVLGGFLGAAAGAGIGAFVYRVSQGYCKKAKLGPLPGFDYVKPLALLRTAYPGEKTKGRAGSQTPASRHQDSSEPLMAIILEPDEEPLPEAILAEPDEDRDTMSR